MNKCVKLKTYWKSYEYWIQKCIIIGSCTCTIIGAARHTKDAAFTLYVEEDWDPNYSSDWTTSTIICGIAGGTIFFVILSIIMDRCDRIAKYTQFLIPYDNRLRLICSLKTALLASKQVLIIQITKHKWSWTTVYSVLSVITVCTLAYITYAIDGNFVNNINALNLRNINAKRLYHTYLVSYIITCLNSLLILITSVTFSDVNEHGIENDYFALMTIFAPFVWILFAKWYNNEFARFKSDISILSKNGSINAIPSTPRSLYHFQNAVIISSGCMVFGCIISLGIVSEYLDLETTPSSFIVIFSIQILIACVMFVNGIVTIKSLS